MTKAANDVVITGIGIVTSEGIGRAPHEALLKGERAPSRRIENERFAPYPVHPMPEIDWSEQIPRRGDQRQMENWQRLGVFAAGLALDDAGLKDDLDACGSMDMIVAAGGGERDQAVDSAIVEEAEARNDPEVALNEKLTTELRPTLFLAQLSNLLAGNISIVHKVTGSSRTVMGEEGAGISAVETAFARIRAGQSTHAIVGAAFNAERRDIILLLEGMQACTTGDWTPLWSRDPEKGGGIILGSGSAFLVLEQRGHAEARGASAYATLAAIASDRGPRGEGRMAKRLQRLAEETGATAADKPLVMSGASGLIDVSAREHHLLGEILPGSAVRGYGGVTGHTVEAQFPMGLALAALALQTRASVPPFDPAAEQAMEGPSAVAVVTTVGHLRGEGVAVLKAED
ncbi:MAG: beta-ketoacyl-ACP synthase [Pararhizobium sp.]